VVVYVDDDDGGGDDDDGGGDDDDGGGDDDDGGGDDDDDDDGDDDGQPSAIILQGLVHHNMRLMISPVHLWKSRSNPPRTTLGPSF
jgi:hypothetical protein